MREESRFAAAVRGLLWPLVLAGCVAALLTGVGNLRSGDADRAREQLEQAVRRAAVTCYADEGIYPPTLDYLQEHYGLQVDTRRFTVDYQVFAENLMPDITVLENEG
jgi:hypothetical protein